MRVPMASSTSSDWLAAAAAAALSTRLTLDALSGLLELDEEAADSSPPPMTLLTSEKILMALATREETQVRSELSCLKSKRKQNKS